MLSILVLNAIFVVIHPHIARAVPLLILVIPVTVASLIGGWKPSVPLAVLAAGVYSYHFVDPIGAIRFGFTEDTVTMTTFVAVAVFLSEINRRRESRHAAREQQRSVLLRSVSHDLRNPLGTIRAASAELRGDTIRDASIRNQLLDLIVDESERMDRIIRNLLSLSRIEAGALAPALARESLTDIVTESVRRLERSDLADHEQAITVDIADDLPDVLVDRTQLDQVLTNLIENSLRHGAGSDEITVSARSSNLRRMVTVAVTDHGPGFGRQHSIEFFQPSGTTGREGVGLAVCKAIIDAHGGNITTDDQPGGGARVEFSVPAAG